MNLKRNYLNVVKLSEKNPAGTTHYHYVERTIDLYRYVLPYYMYIVNGIDSIVVQCLQNIRACCGARQKKNIKIGNKKKI